VFLCFSNTCSCNIDPQFINLYPGYLIRQDVQPKALTGPSISAALPSHSAGFKVPFGGAGPGRVDQCGHLARPQPTWALPNPSGRLHDGGETVGPRCAIEFLEENLVAQFCGAVEVLLKISWGSLEIELSQSVASCSTGFLFSLIIFCGTYWLFREHCQWVPQEVVNETKKPRRIGQPTLYANSSLDVKNVSIARANQIWLLLRLTDAVMFHDASASKSYHWSLIPEKRAYHWQLWVMTL